jgi:hypothetical protein
VLYLNIIHFRRWHNVHKKLQIIWNVTSFSLLLMLIFMTVLSFLFCCKVKNLKHVACYCCWLFCDDSDWSKQLPDFCSMDKWTQGNCYITQSLSFSFLFFLCFFTFINSSLCSVVHLLIFFCKGIEERTTKGTVNDCTFRSDRSTISNWKSIWECLV